MWSQNPERSTDQVQHAGQSSDPRHRVLFSEYEAGGKKLSVIPSIGAGKEIFERESDLLVVVHPLLLEAARCYISTPLEEEMARARDDGVSRVRVGGMMECGGAVGGGRWGEEERAWMLG
jgi:hypothetical protein